MTIKTLTELKRLAKQDASSLPDVRVAVLGECSTQHLVMAIKGYGIYKGFNLDILEADYNQIELLLMNPQSSVYSADPQFIIVFLSLAKLLAAYQSEATSDRARFADNVCARLSALSDAVTAHSRASLILSNYPEFDDAVFGNFAAKVESGFLFQLRKINLQLMQLAQERPGLNVLDVAAIQARIGRNSLFDPKLYINAAMEFGLAAVPVIAARCADIIAAKNGRFAKCVILDLDNTLWGGVIGDDDLEGIQLGNFGIGMAFVQLQRWLVQLKDRGIILAVCSKNNEEIARAPFERHPDMVLRTDDIAVFVANWESKVDNIRHIQKVLNIGFDSMVFLDDNPYERNMLRSEIPELIIPELPADPADYVEYLTGLNLFETASYLKEDKNKARQYQEEARRVGVQKTYVDHDAYLASLEMIGELQRFTRFNIPRVAQLTQRSNQFNLRTVRYSEDDIIRIAESPSHSGIAVTLRDKYGDYGLISVVILERRDDAAFVDTWLMSCRVLQRGVEAFVLNAIVREARAANLSKIVGEYLPTAKNGMVAGHYEGLGFTRQGQHWVLAVEGFEPLNCFIREANSPAC